MNNTIINNIVDLPIIRAIFTSIMSRSVSYSSTWNSINYFIDLIIYFQVILKATESNINKNINIKSDNRSLLLILAIKHAVVNNQRPIKDY